MAARGLTTGAIALLVVASVSLGAVQTAAADGASPGILIGPPGVAIPGRQERIVTRVRKGGTVVTRQTSDGRELGHISLPGVVLGLPRITFRGRIEGPTRDGRAVVLASQYSSATTGSQTRFVVLDTHTLRVVRTIQLRGAFAFDALSPDGQTLYLLQYPASSSPLRYVVRALDLTAGRLYPRPIADESEPDEQMAGLPVARTTGSGGRWVYTLYTSPDRSGHAFVHALDTRERAARCIDLPWRAAELGGIDRAILRIEDGTLFLRERGVGVLADRPAHLQSPLAAPTGSAAAKIAGAPVSRSSLVTGPRRDDDVCVKALKLARSSRKSHGFATPTHRVEDQSRFPREP